MKTKPIQALHLNVGDQVEEWRDVLGFEGLYQISNQGNLKILSGTVCVNKKDGTSYKLCYKEKISVFKCRIPKNGYRCTHLRKDNIWHSKKIHRLVAESFVPNPENKKEVNHINGIRHDNRVENLEWNTHAENCQHSHDIGTSYMSVEGRQKTSERRRGIVIQANPVINLKTGVIFSSGAELSRKINLPYEKLRKMLNKNSKVINRTDFIYLKDHLI